ncbi:hypothetical protein GH714_006607 [Hevea brasiliensis]|uniref:non-specific serine/threonine protein kinase n=1 Tax=Hevea brasiliensis TaxID=3981 RepID=A0A6A6M8W1_HEVBR|nr:hypothetical protein GH714_006607 [Hevea brasiliensis]
MEAFLEACDLWDAVEEDYEVPPLPGNPTVAQIKTHKERKTKKSKAKNCLFAAVSSTIFSKIMTLGSAKAIWDFLKNEYKGDERIKGMKVLNLVREFEMQHMKESETVKAYVDRLSGIANKVRILDHQRRALLRWEKRFDIVLGIARGLLYRHQDSKLKIIHRDLKTSNVLLNSDLNPKISDFGLARILGALSCSGYMSPEYAFEGTISVKSDVFSFGVLMLEIAWVLWNEGKALELMDECLRDSCVTWQVQRCIQVALLCVENYPVDRPAMSSVVFMLAMRQLFCHSPKQPGFFHQSKHLP